MIDLIYVSFSYDNGTEALHNVNLRVDNGEFAFIVGSSGAGKSSIIKLLLRETQATEGTVIVNGYNLNRMKSSQIPKFRRSIGVVFQDFRLIPNMTVYDNVAFSLRVTDASTKLIRQQVPYTLELMELQDKARKYPYELSGGEQQRVAIARALAKNPRLLLCDEPTGALDYVTGKAVLKLLYDLSKERGMTVIIITHNQAIAPMADRIIRIKSGKIRSNEINENIVPIDEIEW